jgi:hypothetical protein
VHSDYGGSDGPYGTLGADRLVRALVERGMADKLPVADKRAPQLERIQPGDLIGYYSRQRQRYGHLVLYLGDGKIGCHTYCRSDLPECTWDNQYTLGLDDDDYEWSLLRLR